MSALMRLFALCAFLCGALCSAWQEKSAAFVTRSESSTTVNYAAVRARVAHGFSEKANEIADTIAVLQDISRATMDLTDQISVHCSQ
jgi:hypothetical protein